MVSAHTWGLHAVIVIHHDGLQIFGPEVVCPLHTYLTESGYRVVFQKSIPAQIRQLILSHYLYKEYVAGFVRKMTLAKRRYENFL